MVFFVKKKNVNVLFAGLGNPGAEYERTKHNVGFRVLDAFASEVFEGGNFRKELGSLIYYGDLNSHNILLAKPQNYMNLSGPSIKWLARKYPPDDIVIIYDDMDLPPGRIRLANSGGSAGHNGMQSIMDAFRKEDIRRIRVGIGGRGDMDGADYVLTPFMGLDAEKIDNAIRRSVNAMNSIIKEGFDKAMNTYNRKDLDEFLDEDA